MSRPTPMKNYGTLLTLMFLCWQSVLLGQCPTITGVDIIDPDGCGGPARIEVNAIADPPGSFLVYSINGGATYNNTYWFNNVPPGTYNIVVQDVQSGCTVDWPPPVIIQEASITITNVSSSDPTDCGTNDGQIIVSTSNGSGQNRGFAATRYSINGSGGPWQTNNVFNGLAAGTYDVWAENTSDNCQVSGGTVTLVAPVAPAVQGASASPVSDCGATNGSISISATPGSEPIQYSISGTSGPWSATSSFPGLTAGLYGIYVRNSNGTCVVSWGVVSVDSPLPPTITDVVVRDILDCGIGGGVIQIFAEGGTGSYQYSINGANGPWTSVSAYSTLSAGNYDVWVRNADGTCPVNWGIVTINEPLTPQISDVQVNDVSSCGGADGSIQIFASAGNVLLEYSISGSEGPYQNSSFFDGLVPGSYSIWVRYRDGRCPVSYDAEVIVNGQSEPQIDQINFSNINACNGSDGSITILASPGDGDGPLQYSITGEGGPWSNSNQFLGLGPGSYNIWVRNANGSCPVEWPSIVTLSAPLPLFISNIQVTDVFDCGESSGEIEITAELGTGDFQYSISGPGGPWFATNIFSGLSAGDYEIWVRNADGSCPVDGGVETITEPIPPTIVDVIVGDVSDCGVSDGTITIQATGTIDLQYAISGPGGPWFFTNDFANLAVGTYKVFVRYANGTCPVEWIPDIVVGGPTPPAVGSVNITHITDCGLTDGTITINAFGGAGAYDYSISGIDGPWQIGNFFDELPAATYDIWVRNAADDSCPQPWNGNSTIFAPPPPVITDVAVSDASDCDLNDGSISISTQFSEIPLEYSVNGPDGPWLESSTIQGLAPGEYSVWVRYSLQYTCPTFWNIVTVGTPTPPSINNVIVENLSDCDLPNDGNITIQATGAGALEYSISGSGGPWSSSNFFGNLSLGSYDIWVRNDLNNSCPENWGVVSVGEPSPPVILGVNVGQINECDANNGSINISATGSESDLQYSISGQNGPWSNDWVFNSLTPGPYDIWVRYDDGSCPVPWGLETISEPAQPNIDGVFVDNPTNCNTSNGLIQITASGGEAPLEYTVFGLGGPWQTSPIFNTLAGGTYSVWVRNQNNSCPIAWGTPITIVEPEWPLVTNISVGPISNCGANDGTLFITADGPSGSLQYSISGSNGPWQDEPLFSGLSAGQYDIWVRYNNGSCVEPGGMRTITEPEPPLISSFDFSNISDCGINDGFIEITATGGSGNYNYSISGEFGPWLDFNEFSGLSAGVYQLWVRNADGSCPSSGSSVTLTEPSQPNITSAVVIDVDNCVTANGTITLSAVGGDGPLQYSIDGPGGPWTTVPIFTDLAAGSYDIWVRNANGSCAWNWGAETINAPTEPVIAEVNVSDVDNCELNNGSVIIEAVGGEGTLEYSISGPSGPWSTQSAYTGLPAGSYDVWVRNENDSCP